MDWNERLRRLDARIMEAEIDRLKRRIDHEIAGQRADDVPQGKYIGRAVIHAMRAAELAGVAFDD
jgi:hypothetical protein